MHQNRKALKCHQRAFSRQRGLRWAWPMVIELSHAVYETPSETSFSTIINKALHSLYLRKRFFAYYIKLTIPPISSSYIGLKIGTNVGKIWFSIIM